MIYRNTLAVEHFMAQIIRVLKKIIHFGKMYNCCHLDLYEFQRLIYKNNDRSWNSFSCARGII